MKFTIALMITMLFANVARADDGMMCLQNMNEYQSPLELMSAAQKNCHEDDIVLISGIRTVSIADNTGPPFFVAAMCKLDKQIVFTPSGKDIICVYRGKVRDAQK